MDSATYQEFSLRTVPSQMAYWSGDFEGDPQTARRDLLCNCALGLAGEAAEIEETPTSDEIGDGYWYAFVLLHVLGVSGYQPKPRDASGALRDVHRSAGTVCELVKKHAFHGRGFEELTERLQTSATTYVDALAALDSQPLEATFEQNIAKLKARYPEGFFERG